MNASRKMTQVTRITKVTLYAVPRNASDAKPESIFSRKWPETLRRYLTAEAICRVLKESRILTARKRRITLPGNQRLRVEP